MTLLTSTDAPSATVTPCAGLWFSTACRHCPDPQPLEEVNPGHADGCRSIWCGRCPKCGREYAVTASICQTSGRGVPGR